MEGENLILSTENRMLREENEYLKMIIDRLIPTTENLEKNKEN